MKYKVGDRVKVKNLDWYNTYKDRYGIVTVNGDAFIEAMKECCGKDLTIAKVYESLGSYAVAENIFGWTDDMFEGLAGKDTEETMKEIAFTHYIGLDSEEIHVADEFEFQDENGNTINVRKVKIVKKKPKYPTTYEECCEVLSLTPYYNVAYDYYRGEELDALYQLLVCRDAYWKIAGDWKPNWKSDSTFYVIFHKKGEIVRRDCRNTGSMILAFPTEEMRDTFYENFKDLINECKELL